ncbi:hypothetical protein QUF89_14860 [Peribacillus simplex]|uniref:Uncharacterized protein n=1 Tax=Peribacillus simplex TaxID=1478 RepID=A0AAW7IPY4_9BACI|nr:hypothetical protein [Peribacillus simplex]
MKGVCEYSKTKINGKILKEKQTQSFTTDMILALAIIFAKGVKPREKLRIKCCYSQLFAIATNQMA